MNHIHTRDVLNLFRDQSYTLKTSEQSRFIRDTLKELRGNIVTGKMVFHSQKLVSHYSISFSSSSVGLKM